MSRSSRRRWIWIEEHGAGQVWRLGMGFSGWIDEEWRQVQTAIRAAQTYFRNYEFALDTSIFRIRPILFYLIQLHSARQIGSRVFRDDRPTVEENGLVIEKLAIKFHCTPPWPEVPQITFRTSRVRWGRARGKRKCRGRLLRGSWI